MDWYCFVLFCMVLYAPRMIMIGVLRGIERYWWWCMGSGVRGAAGLCSGGRLSPLNREGDRVYMWLLYI